MRKIRGPVFFCVLFVATAAATALIGLAPETGDNDGQEIHVDALRRPLAQKNISEHQGPTEGLLAGRNVNMVSGTRLPDGDPWLQRQNEPSIAVSTRNPLHLLAGANDYRTVDFPFTEGELPGLTNSAGGDAWLGIFKSFDGGATWKTSLLPGFPQDRSPEGMASPLKKFSTAADPIVRAGTNGLFYYSGMAFNRAQQRGGGSLFVARFIDNNDVEGGDSIKYLDTRIIEEGDPGNFIDMPRIAVDVPRGMGTVTIDGQPIPRSNIYAAYTVFVGDSNVAIRSQIWFRRSTDCGQTWGPAIKISDAQHIVQGTAIAIDPNSGAVYVAYRRFQHPSQPSAVVIVKSTDFGATFSRPAVIANVHPFDQPTTEDWIAPPFGTSFRTNSYPTMTVDDKGVVYVAWAERGRGAAQATRIVLYTSQSGSSWNGPRDVDNNSLELGHQFMPFLTFAAGKLTMVWYDQRDSACIHWSGVDDWVSDGGDYRQTIDVRAAQADPGLFPSFEPSVQVSRYLWALFEESSGKQYVQQVQFNPPNYPLFRGGTAPFIGDYIEVTPAPMFVRDEAGAWRFNTAPSSAPVFHAVWTDNRDVRPPGPENNYDWTNYTPPASDQGDFGYQDCLSVNIPGMGMRNQNIYTSALTRGVIAAAPANSKPLGTGLGYYPGTGELVQRSFVIYAKNPTEVMKSFRLSIVSPPAHGTASFLEFESLSSLDVVITAFSTIARTVFVRSEDITDTVTIRVVEIDWSGYEVEGGLTGEIVLNPDPTNPQFDPTTDEIHNPNIRNTQIINWTEVLSPNIRNPNIVNPNVINALIINPNVVNPNIVNPNIRNPNIRNPNIVNPNIRNPNIRNANIINPNIVNPNIRNDSLEDAEIYDVTATVVNDGNTTTSYTLKTYAKESIPEDVYLQLLVYKTYYTPAAATEEESGPDACLLKVEAHHELVVNIANPNIRNPNIANPNIRNPNIRNESVENATFALAPGEEAEVMVRIIRPIENDNNNDAQVYSRSMRLQSDVGIRQAFDLETFVESIGFAATSQSVNTYEAREEGVTQPPASASKLIIGTSTLPDGVVGTWYSTTLEAYGGVEPYHWSLNSGTLPPGLGLGSDGTIIGTPATEGFYRFVARVDDSDGDFDTQSFSIYIAADDVTPTPLTIVTTSLPSGVLDYWYGATLDAIGGTWPRTWSLESGYLPPGLELDSDGVISGTIRREADRDYPVTYNFTVRVTDKDGLWDRSALSIVVNERTGVTYTISGYVYGEGGAPLDGVVMRGLPNTPVTGATGYYEDTLPQGWSGTVTPNKAGYSFAPESRSYADLASDMPNQNYNIAVPTYTISGRVTMEGSGLSGVVMSGLPVYAVTDADGYYSASVSYGWSGTVTPTLAGYMFNPPSRDYADVASDQTGQDYAASLVTAAITVTSPNGGETWATGSTQDVTWTQTGLTGTVTIDLYKGGAYTKTLGMAEAPAGTFSWAIDPDETPGTDYRVVIWQGETTDQSDGDFTIVASAIDMAEREALIALYNATNGDNWADNSGWKEPPLYSDGFAMPGTETQWYGVGIYGRHVRQIAMGGNNMSGAIPAQIGGFAYLERLHLQDNQLSGNIPAALGGLTSLRELWLSGNQLSGNIPESLGNLAEIWYLWLGDNRLSGDIPDSLGNLYNLYHLYLNNNELSGSIPASLGNLAANLQDLRLHSNQLRGNIPSSLANLTNLSYLSIDYNALYTQDAELLAFLGDKSPDWYMTQTVAPTDVLATGTGPDTILVSWTPIPYTGDGGGYRVYWRIAAEDPYTFYGQTADKTASSLSVSGLATGQTHYFVVQTRTDPHLYNQNIVDSEYSLEVIAAPLGQVQISGTVTLGDSALAGVLMSGLPGEPVTDANGYYSTSVSYGWSGTVTPTLEGYVFDPPSRAYSNLAEDQLGDDYTANLFQAVIAVTSPNGGEVWTAGSTYDITWTQMGLTGTVTIDLTKGGAYTKTLGTAEAAAGTFSWAIDPGETPGTDYRVTVWQGEIADQSDGEFTIAAAPLEPGERQALIALYHATGGDNWTNNSGWKQPPLHTDGFALPGTEGTWHGITVGAGHVTRVELRQNNLDGAIPTELSNLTNLQRMNLGENQLTGNIPELLGNLTNLQWLYLDYNQLSGTIPATFGSLASLQWLDLGGNQLSGAIPATFGDLTSLQYLYLHNNQLSETIPATLGGMTALQGLILHSNQLSGTIPTTLGQLTALQGLNLSYNQLSGSIPATLGDLTALQGLYLGSNQLSGDIPDTLGNLTALQGLDLSSNQLSGSIPETLGDLTSLHSLALYDNQLSGSIPETLGGLPALQWLHLSHNQLSGSIPPEIGSLNSLQNLYLTGNQLSGSIPETLGDLTALQGLDLSNNQLSGTIPATFGNLTNLEWLYLYSNQLSGEIPLGLGNLISLHTLWLSFNQLSGAIPLEIGELANLQHLALQFNQLSGTIPETIGDLASLQYLYLHNNQLSGSIPPGIGSLTSLREINLYGNHLSGNIPTSLTNLVNLFSLNINYNALYTLDAALIAFLDDKNPNWWATQTVAPTDVSANWVGADTVSVSWTPIPYTGDGGGYRVYWRIAAEDPYTFYGQTADKTASSLSVSGLAAGQTYYFVVQTRTEPHGNNQNTVDSEYSEEVAAAPLGQVLISGTVTLGDLGLAGVVMSGLPGDPSTNESGFYSASVNPGWSGTVTPMLEGYSFDPANRIYVNVASDQAGQDYVAAPLGQVLISGTVTDDDTPLPGVVMSGLPGDPSTNESGYYSASVSYGWSGTVTPTLAGYAFDPPSTTYTNVTADQLGQDYVASPVAAPLFITSTPLPEGVKDEPYETWFEAAGGVPPLQWSIASGTLPSGMVLNADNGRLAGTPTESGVFSFTVRVSDAIEQQDTRELILIIADWVARYDGPGHGFDNPRAIAVDPSGHVYVTGRSRGSGTYADYATIKYSGSGAVQWIVRTGYETGNSEASAVAVDALGNVYVTGSSMGEGTDSDYTTVKYDSSGTVQWIARYDGPASSSDEARAIAVDASGNVYVTGMSYGFMTSADYATIKYDASGVEQWVARYDGPGNIWDEAWAIAVDAAGNVYVTGQSAGSGTGFDYATIKYDASGAELWVARYNGPGNGLDSGRAIAVDTAGKVYVTGASYDSGTGPDYATIKYDPSGAELWVARYTGPGNAEDEARAIAVDTEGNVYVTGKSAGSGTDDDYATIKYNPSGEEQWVARYNGPGNNTDWGQAISVDPMGHVYVAGASQGSGTTFDFATIRYDGWGAEQWVARYDGGVSGIDYVLALAIDQLGNIFVTGPSEGSGTDYDYVTIRYTQSFPSTLIIATEALDVAYEGVPYAKALWAFGGSGSREWSITEGLLPPGMELVPGTGVIEGTPTEAGVFTFAVRVQDGLLSADKDLSLTVNGEGYEFLLAWGSLGTEDGEFDTPWRAAVDGSGDVYVADINNNRIQKFTSDGTFITKWGSMGDGDGQFRNPNGVAVDGSGDVYVADTFNYRIQKFTSDGTFVTKWGSRGEGEGQFGLPRGIAVDGSGNVYVLDYNQYVLKFTSDGTFVTKWGSEGSGDGQFNSAYGMAVDASGDVYVADTYNNRVQKFTSDGIFVTKWGSFGDGEGQFNNPFGIAVDGSGDVYVADTNNNRIQIFTSDGTFVTKWGSAGEGDGQFNTPWGIAVDSSGDVYVLDAGNRVQKFRKK